MKCAKFAKENKHGTDEVGGCYDYNANYYGPTTLIMAFMWTGHK